MYTEFAMCFQNEQVGQKSSVLMAPVRKVEVRSKVGID